MAWSLAGAGTGNPRDPQRRASFPAYVAYAESSDKSLIDVAIHGMRLVASEDMQHTPV